MLYIIGIILILSGFIFQRSKFTVFLQTLFLIIIMGANNGNPDYINYLYRFDNSAVLVQEEPIREPLYLFLNYIAKKAGLSFTAFYFLFMFFCIILLVYAISRFTTIIAPILSFFIMYPMIECAIQIRIFGGMVIFLIGLSYLIDNHDSYGTMKYLLLVMTASMFHITYIFYAPLILIRVFNFRSWSVIWQFFAVCTILLVPVMPYIVQLVFSKNYFWGSSRLSLWKVFGMSLWHVCGVILLFFINKTKNKDIILPTNFFHYVLQINLFTCIIFPLYFGGNTFMRLYRNIFLLNYIFVAAKKNSLYKGIFILYIISTILFFYIIAGNAFTTVFRSIYENNILLGFPSY